MVYVLSRLGCVIPALAMTVGAEWCTELEPVQVTSVDDTLWHLQGFAAVCLFALVSLISPLL